MERYAMNVKFRTLALVLAAVFSVTACKDKEEEAAQGAKAAIAATATSPEAAIASAAQNLRASNLKAVVEASVPPQYLEQVRSKFMAKMNDEPITDEARAEFAQNVERLTAPDAEQKLWAELEPQLTQKQAEIQMQMPMMIGIGRSMLAAGVQQREDLNDAQKQQALAAVDAFAKWAESAKFTDPALAQQAIGVVCSTAREMNLTTLDDARAMSFDETLAKGSIAFGGFKRLLEVYGFSVDQILDSVKPTVVSNDGTNAKVKVNFQMLGTPLDFESDMVQYEGRWYGKESLANIQKEAAVGSTAKVEGASGNG
jgi:hypothetical protein